jgi:ABC-2 type transport system ATP-binding protein
VTKASVRDEASAFEAPLQAAARERVPAWTADTWVTNAIAARGLRKIYRGSGGSGPKEALKGIDLNVPRGSFFGLLGPNGAGKSTFINVLAGLVLKTEGSVSVWGHDIDEEPRRARAAIGVVPQELNLDPFFTPAEVLEFQAGLYGVPKSERRTKELLAALHLSNQSAAYARTLSGGMRRRLLIGKALVHNPPVVILDEPTAGVDIELRHQLWDYMNRLNAQGTTIVLTTHYLEEAEELCDRIAIIDKGEVVACDTTPALVRRIDEKTLLVTPETPLAGVPQGLEDLRAELKPSGALALHYRPSEVGIETMLARVRACGIAIRDLSTIESDLEDIFVQLIRSR